MNYVVAAKYIEKLVSFVKKWVQRFKESKTVDDLPNRGSVGKVTKKDEKRIVALFSRSPGLYLRQGHKMVEIYKKALVPTAEQHFIKKNETWILQEDNDPKHRSRLCTEWKREKCIVTLDWPSQSPDANPIENVWAYIKQKLRGKRVYTLRQLSRQIRLIWKALPLEYAENLVESMPRRCQTIINAGGDWTHY